MASSDKNSEAMASSVLPVNDTATFPVACCATTSFDSVIMTADAKACKAQKEVAEVLGNEKLVKLTANTSGSPEKDLVYGLAMKSMNGITANTATNLTAGTNNALKLIANTWANTMWVSLSNRAMSATTAATQTLPV